MNIQYSGQGRERGDRGRETEIEREMAERGSEIWSERGREEELWVRERGREGREGERERERERVREG